MNIRKLAPSRFSSLIHFATIVSVTICAVLASSIAQYWVSGLWFIIAYLLVVDYHQRLLLWQALELAREANEGWRSALNQ
jgi:hypothetical protein